MKKYLLLCTFATYGYDDDDLCTNTFQVGNFDTLEECYEACKAEIEDQAMNSADAYENDEDQQKEFIKDFCSGVSKTGKIDDSSFARPLADRIIFEHWYDGGNYRTENTFTAIKIA